MKTTTVRTNIVAVIVVTMKKMIRKIAKMGRIVYTVRRFGIIILNSKYFFMEKTVNVKKWEMLL